MKIFILLLNFCFVYMSLSNPNVVSIEKFKVATKENIMYNLPESDNSWVEYIDKGTFYNDFVNIHLYNLYFKSSEKFSISSEPGLGQSIGLNQYILDYKSGVPDTLIHYKFHDKVNTNFETMALGYRVDLKANIVIKYYKTTKAVQNNSYLVFIDIYDFDKDTLIYSFNYETNAELSGTFGDLMSIIIDYDTFFNGRYLRIGSSESWSTGGKYPLHTYAYKRFFFDLDSKSKIENPFKDGLIRVKSNHNDNRVFYLHKEDIVDSDSSKIEIIFLDLNNFASNTIFSTILEKNTDYNDNYINLEYSEDEQYFYFSYSSKIYCYDKINSKIKVLFQNLNNVRFNIDFRNRHILINSNNKLTLYNINSLELEQYFAGLDNKGKIQIYRVPNKVAFVMISNDWLDKGFNLVKYESDILNGIDEGVKNNNLVKDDILVFPNPAGDYVIINIGAINPTLKRVVEGDVLVEIYDVMGLKIQTTPSASQLPLQVGNLKMDVSHLAPGVYFLKIVGSNGACSNVEKFMKY